MKRTTRTAAKRTSNSGSSAKAINTTASGKAGKPPLSPKPPKRVAMRFAGLPVSVHEIVLEELWGKNWKQTFTEMDQRNMELAKSCFLRDNPQAKNYPPICDRTLLAEDDDNVCEEIKNTPTLAVLGLKQMYALARWTYIANWGTSKDAKTRANHFLSALRPSIKGRPQKLATVNPVVLQRSYERLKAYFSGFYKALRDPARRSRNAAKAPRYRPDLRDASGVFNPALEFPEYKYLFDDGIFTWEQVDGNVEPLSPSGMAIRFLCAQYGGSRSALLAKLKVE